MDVEFFEKLNEFTVQKQFNTINMKYPLENLPEDFEQQVEDYCNEICSLRCTMTKQLNSLKDISYNIKYNMKLKSYEFTYCDSCNKDCDLPCQCNPDDDYFNVYKVKEVVREINQLTKKYESGLVAYSSLKCSLEEMIVEYTNYIENLGIDLNNRLYDEEFYSFIHKFEDEYD